MYAISVNNLSKSFNKIEYKSNYKIPMFLQPKNSLR